MWSGIFQEGSNASNLRTVPFRVFSVSSVLIGEVRESYTGRGTNNCQYYFGNSLT